MGGVRRAEQKIEGEGPLMHCASKAIVQHGRCLREGFSEISAVGKEAEAMGHNETYPRAQQLPIRLHSETAMGRGVSALNKLTVQLRKQV